MNPKIDCIMNRSVNFNGRFVICKMYRYYISLCGSKNTKKILDLFYLIKPLNCNGNFVFKYLKKKERK